ncbi:MAG: hypothetical protein ACRDGH_09160 [Candidatus Limnocylindria bacterium]
MTLDKPARNLRPVWIGISLLLAILLAAETIQLYGIIDAQAAIGTDLDYYRFVAERWLTTGVYYTDQQLAGPYVVQTQVHNLYPPHALYLFVPFLYLPDVLWWVLPLGLVAYVVWWCRPVAWSWPLLLFILVLPKSPAQILFGNTDMWIAAFVAGGVRWSWPAVLMTFKPSLGFFAVIGIRSRSWWIALAVLTVASAPLIGTWLQYPTITLNSSAQLAYSLSNLPFHFLPVVAWAVSTRRGSVPMVRWLGYLLDTGRASGHGRSGQASA